MMQNNNVGITTKKIKYVEINLTRNVQHLLEENLKTFLEAEHQRTL